MYNIRNTAAYSVIGRLTSEQIEAHVKSGGLGELVCVTTAGVNHTGMEHTNNRFDGHHDYMFLYVERGEALIKIGNKEMMLGSNSLIIVPPNISYSFDLLYGSHTRWIHFVGSALLDRFGININHVYKIKEPLTIVRLLRQCLETINENSPIKESLLSIYAAELFAAIAENGKVYDKSGINRVLKAMQESVASTVSIGEYAEIAGYSQKIFTKKFKEVTGLNPKEYIINLRMERIAEEIKKSSMSIIDIALNSGFNNYEYFVKMFKKKMGLTPSQYRKSFK